jgi:LDH2 family malate/lactate/ureidoglycolate dehydrogenase
MPAYSCSDLVEALGGLFEAAGLSPADARLCGDWLVDAEASGVSSHGVARASMYLDALRRGKIAARPHIAIEQPRPGVVLVDGGNGMGPVVGAIAMDRAIAAAREAGIAIAVVRHSNHYGAAAYLLRRATEAGFAAFTCSNGSPIMAVHGGADPIISTNPLAAGFPAAELEDSLGFDMATSVAAFGKIRIAQRDGKAIPDDWAVAADGTRTTDPAEAMRGALLPFGGSKGSALALMVEMLAGVLAGAGIGRAVGNPNDTSPNPTDVGHAFVVIDVSAFMPRDQYERRAAELGSMVRGSRPAAGFDSVRLPGTGAAGRRARALADGLVLPEAAREVLENELRKLGLAMPEPLAA